VGNQRIPLAQFEAASSALDPDENQNPVEKAQLLPGNLEAFVEALVPHQHHLGHLLVPRFLVSTSSTRRHHQDLLADLPIT
jgi:hypothetical protein